MKTLILDGFNESSAVQQKVMDAVTGELDSRGWETRVLAPRNMDLRPCKGCFGCWTIRPGRCLQNDDGDLLCRRIMDSELFLIVSPVTFGGYSSSAKIALDRLICLISPFFRMVRGEVHHRPRYERVPAMAALGIGLGESDACKEIFETLHYRNAVNFHPPSAAVEVLQRKDLTDAGVAGVREGIARLLEEAAVSRFSDQPGRKVREDQFSAEPGCSLDVRSDKGASRRVLIMIGSPRKRSTSSAMGEELSVHFRDLGWQVEKAGISEKFGDPEGLRSLTEAAGGADLVVLLCPLYVDSLPAPVTAALETLAAARCENVSRRRQGFMAVLNCGFPESFHNYTALAIARQFAREAGLTWMGGLFLGMGGAIDGKTLKERGGMVRNLRKALRLTAEALDRGQPVPSEAADLMAKPFLPRWMYLTIGNWAWKRQAAKNGVRGQLHAQPYRSGNRRKI